MEFSNILWDHRYDALVSWIIFKTVKVSWDQKVWTLSALAYSIAGPLAPGCLSVEHHHWEHFLKQEAGRMWTSASGKTDVKFGPYLLLAVWFCVSCVGSLNLSHLTWNGGAILKLSPRRYLSVTEQKHFKFSRETPSSARKTPPYPRDRGEHQHQHRVLYLPNRTHWEGHIPCPEYATST